MSADYRTRLEQHGITCSMSRRGNCYDDAVIESWFSTVKSGEGLPAEARGDLRRSTVAADETGPLRWTAIA
jgi:transposase InsO family protein